MSFNIGLNVRETNGTATPSIQAAPTSVTGFIIRSERGIPGTVYRITNWTQFVDHFGSYMEGAYGAYVVKGFFDNGGTTAFITRVVNTKPGTATGPKLASKDGPWSVTPDVKLTITTDRAPNPIDIVFNASPAVLEGGSGSFDLTGDKALSLKVNGVVYGPIAFKAADFVGLATATAAEVAAVLNRDFPGIQAWVEGAKLNVRTDRRGSGAALQATESAAAVLGFPTTEAKGSGDIPDVDTITPEQALPIFAAALISSGLHVSKEKQTIVIQHPDTGKTATIQIGVSSVATAFAFSTALQKGQDGDPGQAALASNTTLSQSLTIEAGYRGQPDVGKWGDRLSVQVQDNAKTPGAAFDLVVTRERNNVKSVLETWSDLNMSNVKAKINDPFAGSNFIRVSAVTGTALPSPGDAVQLKNGEDGAFIDPNAELNAYAEAIALYQLYDIQLLACPETGDDQGGVVLNAALTHCMQEGDRMFVGHTPANMDAGAARDYGKKFQGSKVYGALYFPWIYVADPLGNQKLIPPTGHILGVYARTERERGIWKAPAGNAAILNGALDVKFNITDLDHTDLVKNGSVNAVRYIPGQGIVIDSSRTLSTDTLWLYVNVRLLFNFVKSSLKSGLRWVVQEPNTSTLWNKIKYNSVTPFLLGLWRRGAFGPGSPEQVFTVKVDAENNPPDQIQQGILNIEIYFYPSRPAETILITVGQQEGAATASES